MGPLHAHRLATGQLCQTLREQLRLHGKQDDGHDRRLLHLRFQGHDAPGYQQLLHDRIDPGRLSQRQSAALRPEEGSGQRLHGGAETAGGARPDDRALQRGRKALRQSRREHPGEGGSGRDDRIRSQNDGKLQNDPPAGSEDFRPRQAAGTARSLRKELCGAGEW